MTDSPARYPKGIKVTFDHKMLNDHSLLDTPEMQKAMKRMARSFADRKAQRVVDGIIANLEHPIEGLPSVEGFLGGGNRRFEGGED